MLNWGMVTRKNTFCILSQPASVTPMNNQWFSPYPWVLGSPKFKWVGGWIFPCFLAKSLWITINPMNSNETSISSPCIAIIFLYIYSFSYFSKFYFIMFIQILLVFSSGCWEQPCHRFNPGARYRVIVWSWHRCWWFFRCPFPAALRNLGEVRVWKL